MDSEINLLEIFGVNDFKELQEYMDTHPDDERVQDLNKLINLFKNEETDF